MKRTAFALVLAAAAVATPSLAALKSGAHAPDFRLMAATNGNVSEFVLANALKSGPVVVYFYPKAFTGGCSLEAHAFSEAMPKFQAKHVSVIGVSADDIGTLQKFSKETCAGKFPVAADGGATVAQAYDVKMPGMAMAGRVSYIINPNGQITYVHDDPDASTHVPALLKAVGAE